MCSKILICVFLVHIGCMNGDQRMEIKNQAGQKISQNLEPGLNDL